MASLYSSQALERELDAYKVSIEQSFSMAAAFSALIAPSEAEVVDLKVQQISERFRRISKRVRNRSIDLEDAVTNSIDVGLVSI